MRHRSVRKFAHRSALITSFLLKSVDRDRKRLLYYVSRNFVTYWRSVMKDRNLVAKHARQFNKAAVMRDRKKDMKRGVRKHKKNWI